MGEALIVVDDKPTADRLAEAVRRKGFTPTVWTGAPLDVLRIKELRPDLVFLASHRVELEDSSLCQQLKLDPGTNLTPVIEVGQGNASQQPRKGFFFSADVHVANDASTDQIHHAMDQAIAWRVAALRDGIKDEINVCLHSELAYLDELNKLLAVHFCAKGLGEAEAKQVTMAIRELGANAIEWGHRKQVERIVTIQTRLNARKLTIFIRDTGPGFNRCELPHAANHDDPVSHLTVREELGLREGGFGIMIAGGLVDEMRYNESGNEVCLVKHLGTQMRASDSAE